ncbi:MAG: hypothetical protein AB7P20_13370 [Rhizobiaceae bacterium]
MFDIVTADQHKPAMIIDCGRVHHRKTCFAIAAAGNICPGGKMANRAPNEVQDNESKKRRNSGHDRDGIIRANEALNPFPHVRFPSIARIKPGGTLSRQRWRLQGEMPLGGIHFTCLSVGAFSAD